LSFEEHILNLIKAKGLISVEEFMNIALTGKEESYYINNIPLGRKGDFITAPEISQLFGETIAIWAMLAWEKLQKPSKFNLIELGPGQGTLMRDILRSTDQFLEFYSSIEQITLIECNKKLIKGQAELLNNFGKKIIWAENIFQIQTDLPSIIIANEFLDALPIKQYIKKADEWYEIMIGSESNNEIKFIERALIESEATFLKMEYGHLKDGDIIETSYEALKVVQYIMQQLLESKGAAIIIDYGYNRKKSNQLNYISSLQGVKNHHYHPILEDIGKTDLSAMVDFERLINVLENNQCTQYEYLTQKEFLLKYGISLRFKKLLNLIPNSAQDSLFFGYDRLINADKMGNLYKALEFYIF
jgi:NADH dehydrogenase [ubiquinone] 1 alpha subcomplex assembly factor 7